MKLRRPSLKIGQIDVFVGNFFVMSMTYNSSSQLVRLIGILAIVSFLVLCLFGLSNTRWYFQKKVYISYILFIGMNFIYFFMNPTSFAIRGMCLAIYPLILLEVFSNMDFSNLKVSTIKNVMILQFIIIIIPYFLHRGFSIIDGGFLSVFATTSYLGDFSLLLAEICFLAFVYDGKKDKGWIILMALFIGLVILAKIRTAMIGVALLVFFIFFEGFFARRTRNFFRFFSVVWIVVIIIAIMGYIALTQGKYAGELGALFYKYTGKPFASGRQIIWRDGYNAFLKRPIIGHGIDYSNINFSSTGNSIHNSYLDLLLRGGISAIAAFVFIIGQIFDVIMREFNQFRYYIFICSLVNLFLCMNEVIIINGQSVLQTMIWIIMALGMNTTMKPDLSHSKFRNDRSMRKYI